MKHWTRKEFLKASLVGGSAALIARPRLLASSAPAVAAPGSANGDIRVAVVGFNKQGGGHINAFRRLQQENKGARLVALCDVDSEVMGRRVADLDKDGIKVKTYTDYRKLLEDPDIDAVSIATPNHWHALQTIWACQAGKDVYVEKPLSNNVWEGRKVVEAVQKYGRIVQAGTQNRSSQDVRDAIAFINAGSIGKIQWVRGLCYKPRPSIGKTTKAQRVIPAGIDYNLWCGPTPLVPPTRNTFENGPIHYDWHWFWNYGGGDIANQGIHQMDVARWFLGEPGLPPSVQCIGGRLGYDDDAETPNTQVAIFNYAKAPLIFEVRGLPSKTGMRAMDSFRGSRIGVIVQCEGGYALAAENGTVIVNDNNNQPLQKFTQSTNGQHRGNFLAAMRSRKPAELNGPVEECHYSSALCHLANISYRVGQEAKTAAALQEAVAASEQAKDSVARMLEHLKNNEVDLEKTPAVVGPTLTIDGQNERFVGSEKEILDRANALLTREYRAPFVVPEKV